MRRNTGLLSVSLETLCYYNYAFLIIANTNLQESVKAISGIYTHDQGGFEQAAEIWKPTQQQASDC